NKPLGDITSWVNLKRSLETELSCERPQDWEERVRDRAYQIWVSEGWPDDAHEKHWRRACQEIALEQELRLKRGANTAERVRSSVNCLLYIKKEFRMKALV
ncbi:hypothetical protein FHS85_005023, partial [Rhodoligotrophos appendicifer]